MTKRELRKIYKEKRHALTALEKDKLEDLLLISFQKFVMDIPDVILSYRPLDDQNEYDPYLIERFCAFRNPFVTIAFPVIEPDHTFLPVINNEQFKRNIFGIEEPEGGEIINAFAIDLVIVPLLSFDLKGYRVGYGKGYYDKFLGSCRTDVIKAGFSFFAPVESFERDEHDIPLDVCFTPEQTYTFLN